MAAPLLLARADSGRDWASAANGARGAAGDRERPAGPPRLVRDVPPAGAPIGFFFSGTVFLLLSRTLTDQQFFRFGWRIPFLASAALVVVGLYVRLTITETPVFRDALHRRERVKVPMVVVFRDHFTTLVVGVLASLATFVLFYLMTVFALSWGTTALGYRRDTFLMLQLLAIVFFALAIPVSAVLAERSRRGTLLGVSVAIAAFGLVMAPMLTAGRLGGSRHGDGLSLRDDLRPLAPCCGAVSHRSALHRQLADLQLAGNLAPPSPPTPHLARPNYACSTSATTDRRAC